MSSAGKPAALNWSATYWASSGTRCRPITVGRLITCSNIAWVESRWAGVSAGGAAAAGAAKETAERAAIAMRMAKIPRERELATLSPLRGASSYEAVTLRQIFRAAHFLEATDRALEFEVAVALGG